MQKTSFDFAITITLLFTIIISLLLRPFAYEDQQLAFANQTTMTENPNNNNNDNPANPANDNSSSSIVPKVAFLNFYDDEKNQFTNAKPILDKYGFKASFFITCDWVGLQKSKDPRMTWQDISLLQKDGQDIESKTMTHKDMSHLSAANLNFEVAQSKKCLSGHGISKVSIFATPHGDEWYNAP